MGGYQPILKKNKNQYILSWVKLQNTCYTYTYTNWKMRYIVLQSVCHTDEM